MSESVKLVDLKRVISEVISKESEDYIASGFFKPDQIAFVEQLEKDLYGMGRAFYSPRNYVVKTTDLSDQRRMFNIRGILDLNCKKIKAAPKIYFNFTGSSKDDIGTLFEYGYALADRSADRSNPVYHHRELVLFTDSTISTEFENYAEMLEDISIHNSLSENLFDLLYYRNMDRTEDEVKPFLPSNYTLRELTTPMELESNPVFLIDDRPRFMFIIMGYLYRLGKKYWTASLRDFGSNIMIAASSSGHIKLNGLPMDGSRMNEIN